MSILREHIVKRFTRSWGWRKLRNHQIKEFPFCIVCHSKKWVEVHHIKSFKNHPELELDPENLATLCRRCHLLIGHCGWWQAVNIHFMNTVQYLRETIRLRRV